MGVVVQEDPDTERWRVGLRCEQVPEKLFEGSCNRRPLRSERYYKYRPNADRTVKELVLHIAIMSKLTKNTKDLVE